MYLEGWDSGCGTSSRTASALGHHLAISGKGEGGDSENSGRSVDWLILMYLESQTLMLRCLPCEEMRIN